MTNTRTMTMAGMALGLLWAIGVLWLGTTKVNIPIFSYTWTLALSFLFPGLVLAAMIGVTSLRRFADEDENGATTEISKAAKIDKRVLQNTVEQLVLALALWPVAGHILAVDGPGVVLCLGIGFAIARLVFWFGSHFTPLLRAFGFAATFYPSLMVVIWCVLWWVVG